MIAMVKDGKTVNVPDAHIDAYLRMGYAPMDATYTPVPGKTTDQRIRELEAENASLVNENATLKADLEVYKAQVFKDLAPAVDDAPKPKRGKGKSSADET